MLFFFGLFPCLFVSLFWSGGIIILIPRYLPIVQLLVELLELLEVELAVEGGHALHSLDHETAGLQAEGHLLPAIPVPAREPQTLLQLCCVQLVVAIVIGVLKISIYLLVCLFVCLLGSIWGLGARG